MPLVSKFESLERAGYTINFPEIIQGGAGYWEDKSMPGFIVAKCLDTDTGGIVFAAEESLPEPKGPTIVSFTPEGLGETILAGFDYRLEIIDENDEYGNLIIQHIMPDGRINSLN